MGFAPARLKLFTSCTAPSSLSLSLMALLPEKLATGILFDESIIRQMLFADE
jgi:hypothetical protein